MRLLQVLDVMSKHMEVVSPHPPIPHSNPPRPVRGQGCKGQRSRKSSELGLSSADSFEER